MEPGNQVRTGTASAIPSTIAPSGVSSGYLQTGSVITNGPSVSIQTGEATSVDTIQALNNNAVELVKERIVQYSNSNHETPTATKKQTNDWTILFQGARFTHNGKYVAGYVESATELQEAIDAYRSVTNTNYLFKSPLTQTSYDESILREKFLNSATRPRLLWQQHIGEPTVPYDGVPFISQGEYTEYPCVFMNRGIRRGTKSESNACSHTMAGCNAKIFIRRILRFSSHHIVEGSWNGVAAMRRTRKQVLDDLVDQICRGLVHPVERFYLSLPTGLAHVGHAMNEFEEPSIGEMMSAALMTELVGLLDKRVVFLDDLQRGLHTYAENNLSAELALNRNNSSLLPSRYCTCYHVYWLYKNNKLAKTSEIAAKSSIKQIHSQKSKAESPSTVSHSLYGIVIDDGTAHGIPDLVSGSSDEMQDSSIDHGEEEMLYPDSVAPLRHFTPSDQALPTLMVDKTVGKSPVAKTHTQVASPPKPAEEISELSLARSEVHSLLKIIGNQTYASQDAGALHNLRRQLTKLCTEFSCSLSSVSNCTASDDDGRPAKMQRL